MTNCKYALDKEHTNMDCVYKRQQKGKKRDLVA